MATLAKAIVVCLIVATLGTFCASTDMSFDFDCTSKTFKHCDAYGQNVESLLTELKTITPVNGNFYHRANRTNPRVYGTAHCFSSLTSSEAACTSCLHKAIKTIRAECWNTVGASAGSAAAGCNIQYDSSKIKP
ncbi:uncharacterized protein A4U43_C05F21090 [Asparagus officinalis]|uniref:Gnk2-homologous domain-containing protein n=1 Tax=Asparagus officinalis TaxID=4686 RepID=A0A5P1EXB9_ASPOF|nr:antifungal protein ginkbilobin-2-like [Asparagus officinalis]ONK69269.1 uncharacterized protein A4U43_C05F21090 [Asparagus officinalis]